MCTKREMPACRVVRTFEPPPSEIGKKARPDTYNGVPVNGIINENGPEPCLLALEHAERLSETQIGNNVKRKPVAPKAHVPRRGSGVVRPIRNFKLNTRAVVLVRDVGDDVSAEDADMREHVVLHGSEGGVAETLREYSAFTAVQGLVDDGVSVKSMWVRGHDRVELGLLDILAVGVNVYESCECL